MSYQLHPLPYELDALSPLISRTTLEYHYGKHHKGYVDKLNKLMEGRREAGKPLVELFTTTDDKNIYNNAAQAWNHGFYWQGMSPNGGGDPPKAVRDRLAPVFGDFASFKKKFTEACATLFGSGWGWLALTEKGVLEVVQTADAENPFTRKRTPILACDVWEHAYYLDYKNERRKYIDAFWQLVNWEFVQKNLENPKHVARIE